MFVADETLEARVSLTGDAKLSARMVRVHTVSEEASGKELLSQVHPSLSALNVPLRLPPVNHLLRVDHTLHGTQPDLLFPALGG